MIKNTIKKKTIEAPYWFTLFVKNEEVTPEILIKRLKSGVVRDPDTRLKYPLLVLIDGVLCPRSLNMKIQEETAEVLRDVDKFLNHPWGRILFEMTMSCIKSRKASGLAQTIFVVQDFVHALQLVLLEDVPDIEKSMPVDTPVFVSDDSEEEEPKEKVEGKNVVKSRKRKKSPVCGSSSDGSQPVPFSESQMEWLAKQISSQVSLVVSSMEDRLVSRLKGKSGAALVGGKVVAPVSKGKVKPPSRAKKTVLPKRKRMRVDGRLRQIRDDDETETATNLVGDESETASGNGGEDVRTASQKGEASVIMEDVETEERGGKGGRMLERLVNKEMVSEYLAPDPEHEDVVVLSGDDLNDQEAAAKSGDGLKEQDGGGKSGDGFNDQDAAAKSGDVPKEQDVNDDQDAATKNVNDDAECQGKESREGDAIDKKWLEVEKYLADGGKINFGRSLFLVAKDVEEIVGLQVVMGTWMMDAFIKYFCDKWATFEGSKFAFLVLGHRIKFEKSVKKKYVFDQDLMSCFPLNFDTLYFPFNFDKQHWVGMCFDIRGRYLYLFDCNKKVRRDTRLQKEIKPLLEMLPFVVRQVSPQLMNSVPTNPFLLSRDTLLPTCLHPSERGLMSLLFIERHAVGGIEASRGVRPEELAVEAKKLLIKMYDGYAEK
ncbi:predicted protein [Arabidopsis lyrata subsp. lyrata]|uniref:Predicted protein n=1 Tax=Arabidopsis lyrata subsp. lyrata TaxID=81972 RepID=D7ML33_ARALL|nr:predicted protein [Arabidopsis lyrata subsp. lyrata]